MAPALRAYMLNPGGFALEEATRRLRAVGYSDYEISRLIRVMGTDSWGNSIWRWRTQELLPGAPPGPRR
jgi:hypothetical protein